VFLQNQGHNALPSPLLARLAIRISYDGIVLLFEDHSQTPLSTRNFEICFRFVIFPVVYFLSGFVPLGRIIDPSFPIIPFRREKTQFSTRVSPTALWLQERINLNGLDPPSVLFGQSFFGRGGNSPPPSTQESHSLIDYKDLPTPPPHPHPPHQLCFRFCTYY